MPSSSPLIDGLAALVNGASVSWTALGVTPADFLDACNEAGLTGLVHQVLIRRSGSRDWPKEIQENLARQVRRDAAEELLRQHEIISTLDVLASAGVTPILLKGTSLAYTTYAAPSFRPRADTDLLIAREQVDQARQAMTGLGFVAAANSGGERLFAQFQLWKQDRHGVEHVFDFHWKISTQSMFADVLTYDELAVAAEEVPALGRHARGAGALHALLLACIHPAMHHRNAEHLLWMYDIHLLASRFSETQFDGLAEIAVAKHVAAICAHELARAGARFGFHVPPRVMAALAAQTDEPSAAYLRPRRRWIHELISSVQGLPSWGDRLGLVREVVFPSPRYMLTAYGNAATASRSALLLPALYVHRILRGTQRILAGRK
jgi:Uncharacterised nucleotidyltransferase